MPANLMQHPGLPILPQVASFECRSCETIHQSADGNVPVGWTTRHATAWCADCTRAGIPLRDLRRHARGRVA